MGFHADMATFDALVESHASFGQWMSWLLSDAAPAMITGLLVIGAAVAFVGYWVAMVGWRWWVGRKWKRRNPVQS
jgi:uncharacterized protein (DUF2062 family)